MGVCDIGWRLGKRYIIDQCRMVVNLVYVHVVNNHNSGVMKASGLIISYKEGNYAYSAQYT